MNLKDVCKLELAIIKRHIDIMKLCITRFAWLTYIDYYVNT